MYSPKHKHQKWCWIVPLLLHFLAHVPYLLGTENHRIAIDLKWISHFKGWHALCRMSSLSQFISCTFKRPFHCPITQQWMVILGGVANGRTSGCHGQVPTTAPSLLNSVFFGFRWCYMESHVSRSYALEAPGYAVLVEALWTGKANQYP